MAVKMEINFKGKVFFYKATLWIAVAFLKLGFYNTRCGVLSLDFSKKKDIVIWYFCYPIIR
jgi:hypothetical protein